MSSSSYTAPKHQRKFRDSAWGKGHVSNNRRSSSKEATHTAGTSVYSLPTRMPMNHRRDSNGDNAPSNSSCSSSKSADHLFDMTTCSDNSDEDQLENQTEENLYLTQEVLDLKMRLAHAMAQIDAEKHMNRLQAEQISHLLDDNDELKCYLHQAYEQISELGRDSNGNNACNHRCANLVESASQAKPEGWLHRVASAMKMSKSTSSFTCTNLSTDSQTQRKHTAALASAVTSNNSTTVNTERAACQFSTLSISSLADEELPVSSNTECRPSMHSSLSTFRGDDTYDNECLSEGQYKGMRYNEWLDAGVDCIEQKTFAARNA